ncbi:16S rRNA (guanine(527)-N(7))-methyltransferase RsmG [[Limnothrix rosea] IAM M-220]|uniref:16S rRNA (guanine(527)-N(7))-methyltransferase RsmG n=1 Tax=[Limnothrix rosea] IAM M-220 TaxID=454133 RepID=UPI00095BB652|nr:16S rRNA (guanine(527)-N(7))-methyltransferase RsmG [[Limnothrix rosea] IAM M-220]OKH18001.1 16S rRNA (guanine(527)-N(7))-methyltransferase RsmG [[Limnothrix rosea] IAM M-220]
MTDVFREFQSLFDTHKATLTWQPPTEVIAQFSELYNGIFVGNQRLNLTRITSVEDFWEKHLWDSLVALNLTSLDIPTMAKVIDVGTGGGFPGLPLAIAYPEWHITLLDSTQKKITFLAELSQDLNLKTQTIAARAETVGQDPIHREQYDLVTIRAVAKASVCLEYALPLLKIGGVAILYRGQWTPKETSQLLPAIAQCGGELIDLLTCETPITKSQRTCLYIQKKKPSDPHFPRAIGTPKQSPLAPV